MIFFNATIIFCPLLQIDFFPRGEGRGGSKSICKMSVGCHQSQDYVQGGALPFKVHMELSVAI
jgi:hypothetical protein